MKCWICDTITTELILLPTKDGSYTNLSIHSIPNWEYKVVEPFTFTYLYICTICLDKYLQMYPVTISKLHRREIKSK
jgi:hypothetical protein